MTTHNHTQWNKYLFITILLLRYSHQKNYKLPPSVQLLDTPESLGRACYIVVIGSKISAQEITIVNNESEGMGFVTAKFPPFHIFLAESECYNPMVSIFMEINEGKFGPTAIVENKVWPRIQLYKTNVHLSFQEKIEEHDRTTYKFTHVVDNYEWIVSVHFQNFKDKENQEGKRRSIYVEFREYHLRNEKFPSWRDFFVFTFKQDRFEVLVEAIIVENSENLQLVNSNAIPYADVENNSNEIVPTGSTDVENSSVTTKKQIRLILIWLVTIAGILLVCTIFYFFLKRKKKSQMPRKLRQKKVNK